MATLPPTTSPYDNWCVRDILDDQYAGGHPIKVELSYHTDSSVVGATIIEDIYPTGWVPSDISIGGEDSGTSVRWTPPAESGMFSYTLTPPVSARDTVVFGGLMSVGGSDAVLAAPAAWFEEVPITGDIELTSVSWKLYWTDVATKKIQRANLNGSGIEDLVELFESDSYVSSPLFIATEDITNVQAFLDQCYLPPNQHLVVIEEAFVSGVDDALAPLQAIMSMASFVGLRDVSVLSGEIGALLLAVTELVAPDPLSAVLLAEEAFAVLKEQIELIEDYTLTPNGGEVLQPPMSDIISRLRSAMSGPAVGDEGQPRPMSDFQEPQGIAIEFGIRKMYWVGLEASAPDIEKIQRSNLDGSNVEDVLVVEKFGARDLAISGGKVYWFARYHNEIRRCELDGSNPETVIDTVYLTAFDVGETFAMAKAHVCLAADDTYLYVAFGTKIVRTNLDIPDDMSVLVDDLTLVRGIVVDPNGGKVYWADGGADRIQRANLDGSDVETLAEGISNPQRVAIDPATGMLYWTDSAPRYGPQLGMSGRIQRMPMDGTSPPTTVLETLDLPQGLAIGPDMPPIVATTTTVPPATTVPSTTTAPVATTVPAVTTAPPTTTTTPPPLKTDPPVVLAPIFDVDTVVNGTSVEADGTVIQAYINDQPASWTTTVTGGAWAMTGLDLTACDTVKATAKALDKELSDDSNEVPVLPLALWGDPCECAPPTSDCDPAGVRTFQLTLKVEGEGDILPALGTTTHVASDRIRLTAVPAQGWELLRWRAEVPAHTTWSSVPAISNLTDISLIHTVREDAIIIAEFTRCTVPTAA